MAKTFVFKGYEVGLEFTPGAPVGTSPPTKQRVLVAPAGLMDAALAMALKDAARILGQAIEQHTTVVARNAGLKWRPIASQASFMEAKFDEIEV